MLPLYRDPHFTFRFADDRLVDRFRLDGIEAGTPVSVFAIDSATGEHLGLIAEAIAGDGGWVNLSEALVVRAGGGFGAVPVSSRLRHLGRIELADAHAGSTTRPATAFKPPAARSADATLRLVTPERK